MENGSLRVCLVHTMGVLVANFSLPYDYEYGCGGILAEPDLKTCSNVDVDVVH